jgi:hypothetical protein
LVSPTIQAAISATELAIAESTSLGAAISSRVGCFVAKTTAEQTIEVGPRLELRDGELRPKAITNLSGEFLKGTVG